MKKLPRDTVKKRVARYNYQTYMEALPYFAYKKVLTVERLAMNRLIMIYKGYEPTHYLLNQKRSFRHKN